MAERLRRPPSDEPARTRQQPAPASLPRFGDRLAERVVERESQVVLGLDPDPSRLWPSALAAARRVGAGASPAERAAAAVVEHCVAVIAAAGPACVAVKPQVACFERLGAAGWAALAAVCERARADGLLVLVDAKRGDVPTSAAAYAQALLGSTPTPFGSVRGLEADAVTANPLLGTDSLEPFVTAADACGAGVFALVRTSNPGARDIQELELRDGERLWERLAVLVDALGRARVGRHGLAAIGAVTGATAPEHLARLRALMPRAPFLLPGIGAQGGRVEQLAPAWLPGRAGGVVSASRSIADAHADGGDPAARARAAAEQLRAQAWRLSEQARSEL